MSKGKIIGLIGGLMVFIAFIWILVNSWNQVIDAEKRLADAYEECLLAETVTYCDMQAPQGREMYEKYNR